MQSERVKEGPLSSFQGRSGPSSAASHSAIAFAFVSRSISAQTLVEVAKCVGHFRNNIHRMRYGDCRAKGMPVGSGVIEGGCKSVICGRMKKGGARWSMEGANNIMALRRCSPDNQMTDLFDWRRAA